MKYRRTYVLNDGFWRFYRQIMLYNTKLFMFVFFKILTSCILVYPSMTAMREDKGREVVYDPSPSTWTRWLSIYAGLGLNATGQDLKENKHK